jgi:hypothetical protein
MNPRSACARIAALLVAAGLVACARSAHALDLKLVRSDARYVPPLTFPYFNESAQIRNEIRPLYFYNHIPDDFVSVGGFDTGGDLHAFTVQGRAAITDHWAIVVTKNGYADVNFDDLLPSDDGALNFAFGAKYAALSLPDSDTYLTGGLKYEAPSGDIESGNIELQGGGDGFFDLFVSFESALWHRLGVQTSSGFHMAVDPDHDATSFHASIHVDYEVVRDLFGVIETNVLTALEEGDRTDSSVLGSFEGYDVLSFGSTSAGTVATVGLGARYRLGRYALFGLVYELPVTAREDIIDFRIGCDLVVHL